MDTRFASSPNGMVPLYGLLLIGGKSKRMGQEKALLTWETAEESSHKMIPKETLLDRSWQVMTQIVSPCYLSVNENQVTRPEYQDYSPWMIPDDVEGFNGIKNDNLGPNLGGPILGIYSAMKRFPQVAWLVLAVDMPNISSSVLQQLIHTRQCLYAENHQNPSSAPLPQVIVFESPHPQTKSSFHASFYEPLCGIYEPESLPILQHALLEQRYSLQRVLEKIHQDGKLVKAEVPQDLDPRKIFLNLNTPEGVQGPWT
ncbi:MAG: molybdenum cofactor guanylyltransferase [Cyanobacteria bacterium]|nr:molybdenum cofactor guanylyltransferase [Cyanobacteriota bacterium]